MARTVLLVCGFLAFCKAYNVDIVYPVIYGDPFGNHSLFGYRVQFLKSGDDKAPWVLVGAPRANSQSPNHKEIKQPGRLYRCKWGVTQQTIQETCLPYAVDLAGNVIAGEPADYNYRNEIKDNGWLGGSLAVQHGNQTSQIAVCSPRWKNTSPEKDVYSMNGACYFTIADKKSEIALDLNFQKRFPFVHRDYQNIFTEKKKWESYYKYAEAGMDVHFTEDQEMLVGSPGVFNWTGTVARYKHKDSNGGPDGGNRRKRQLPRGPRRISHQFTDLFVPHPGKTPELHPHKYFGSSVSSGRFLTESKLYVAGAPRAGDLTGKVYLFDFPEVANEPLKIFLEESGKQAGEYFGASLLVVDLNQDGCDDLIVGSPMYSMPISTSESRTRSGDEGKITVYLNTKSKTGDCEGLREKQTLMGSKAKGARFGSAIATLGDISNDDYPDIVVGAPYETSGITKGAIYIYYGHPENGLITPYVQRITAEDVAPELKLNGFGIHMASFDIDSNGYPDLVIGSYVSNNAVVLRTRPLVKFHLSIRPPADIDRGINSHPTTEIVACANYSAKLIPKELCAEFTIQLDGGQVNPRLELRDNGVAVMNTHSLIKPLRLGQELCFTFVAAVTDLNQDYSRPADVRFSVSLRSTPLGVGGSCGGSKPVDHRESSQAYYITNQRKTKRSEDGFCSTCPVLDKRGELAVNTKIAFKAGCGDDDVCVADLAVNYTLLDVPSPLIIGVKQLKFKASMTNYGEPAFRASLVIELPEYVSLTRSTGGPSCKEERLASHKGVCGRKKMISPDDTLVMIDCMMEKPLTKGQKIDIEFILDISRIPPGNTDLCLGLKSQTSSNETPDSRYSSQTTIMLPLQTHADIAIVGVAGREQVTYERRNETYKGSTLVDFTHRYQVFKLLPSPLTTVEVIVYVPKRYTWGSQTINILDLYSVKAERQGRVTNCDGIFSPRSSGVEAICSDSEKAEGRKGNSYTSGQAASVWDQNNSPPLDVKFTANRTSWFNCSMKLVQCSRVTCTLGSADDLIDSTTQISITIEAAVDIQGIWPTLFKRDIIVVASDAHVWITDPRNALQLENDKPDYAVAVTYFVPFGMGTEEKVASTIIILAVLAGILVLGLITFALFKAGFFVRKQPPTLTESIPLKPTSNN